MIRLLRRTFSNVKDRIRKQRAQRLAKLQQSLPTKTNQNLQKIRNIAIIAHIDAGKTTTTQRMLFYSGALPEPGQVDQGTTTMDYLPQQRARGITIRSAAISFNWSNHQINLIDTPGHVDFSGEVARSLRVLDGVVTIFDAVHGVQTQTEKVWMQANQKNLPKLAFINKMDRLGGSVQNTVKTIKDRLKAEAFVLQEAVGEAESFKGVVDLLKMEVVGFEGFRGGEVVVRKLEESDGVYSKAVEAREKLIEKISEYDDQIADLYLAGKPISHQVISAAIKRVLNNPKHLPHTCAVLLGASVKNKGVQPLLDAIINYLPSPSQGNPIKCAQNPKMIRKPLKKQHLCAYIFKIIYDKQKGPLCYARVYSGTLTKTTALKNTTKQVIQKIQFLYRVRADKYVLVQQVHAGDIIAISGMKNSSAGDTLINANDQRFILQQLHLPAAIFMAPFEVQSVSAQSTLERQLKIITKQDNSLTVQQNSETGQLVVSGLGELHLEIVRDRLVEAGIPTKMGKLRIGYRETFDEKIKKRLKFARTVNKQDFWFQVELEIIPVRGENQSFTANNDVVLSFSRIPTFDAYWAEYMKRKTLAHKKKNMEQGADTDVEMGRAKQPAPVDKTFGKYVKNPTKVVPIDQQGQNPQLHHISTMPFQFLQILLQSLKLSLFSGRYKYPLISLQIHITDGVYDPDKISKPIVSQCASKLLTEMIHANSILLEPIVDVELIGEEELLEHAVKDIIKKRGRVEDRMSKMVRAKVPAEGIRGWVKTLRAMGFDTEIKFSGYEQVQGVSPTALVTNQQ